MHDLSNRKILLVGGAGFIGHNLAFKLKEFGAEVFIADSLSVNNYCYLMSHRAKNPSSELYLKFIKERLDLLEEKHIPLMVLDARDYHALSRYMDDIKADTLVHLAAVAHADRSNKDPYSTFDHSLRTLENALDNTRSSKSTIKHFVYFSSSMVYGHFPPGGVTEETVCDPLGIYGALKYSGEKIVIAYNQVFEMPYTIVRPSALYGPRCISRRVIQIFLENAFRDEEIVVNGKGDDKLDFTYVDDLVSGIVNVLGNESAKGGIFNLTYGESRAISDLVGIMKKYFPKLKVKYVPKDGLTPDRGTLNIDKAKKSIGYAPKYPLEKGIEEYINWYREFLKK
ncbi:MAG: NAD(P)-dependent oxidoreductase [Candidatus Omnitrophica bacterium]|nr:NAD(P)-dependent oxidoreductase [Candidatus Omnitrophota bacterium]